VCVCACVRARVRACVRACAYVSMCKGRPHEYGCNLPVIFCVARDLIVEVGYLHGISRQLTSHALEQIPPGAHGPAISIPWLGNCFSRLDVGLIVPLGARH